MSESSPAATAANEPQSNETMFQWGPNAPRGAKVVFARIIKEGANVPLFLGQTLVNALRDLGYNDTTSALCEHVDNAIQWGAKEVRVYFNETGRKQQKKIDVLVYDDGIGMAPNVLRAATAFGGSMSFDDRNGIGRYGVGMKGAALSMGEVLEIFSWQEPSAIYSMTLDVKAVGDERGNVVTLPQPQFHQRLPEAIVDILTSGMVYPKNAEETQERLTEDATKLAEKLGRSGTLIFIPDCDRLTYRTARPLVDHATKEMARVYRRQLNAGLKLFINNRRIEPFDPTYQMASARHARVEGLKEKSSRLVRKVTVPIPVQESNETVTKDVIVGLYMLPIDEWDQLPTATQKHELRVFDDVSVSFMRSDREVHAGAMREITGKHWSGNVWRRLEIDFPPDLDEAFGVAVNKQGVRPKSYVTDAIRTAIHEDLQNVRRTVEEHWARRSAQRTDKGPSEAERRANEAEAFQTTALPQPKALTEEEQRALDEKLKALAVACKRSEESDEEAFARVKASRYITTFKHDEDAPFYRVDFQLGKVILTINSAHAFFKKLYEPLSRLAQVRPTNADGDGTEVPVDLAALNDVLPSLELLLLSLARTQSSILSNDTSGEQRRMFDAMRRQWSLDLANQLTVG